MIDKLGYVPKPSAFTVEQVQTPTTPPSTDAPITVETSHTAQETQLTQSKKSELAMFGSIQQRLIGAEFDRISQPPTKLENVAPAGNPALQSLQQKLEDLKAQKQQILSELKQLEDQL